MTALRFAAWRRAWIASALIGLGLCLLIGLARGQSGSFDHLSTGYALTGVHQNQRCENCHRNGVFKGTPRDCESCHTAGARLASNNMVKSASHVATTLACDACHSTRSFVGARVNHAAIVQGGCATCHNGTQASGKPASHMPTTVSCDTCHRASAWLPASGFAHVGVAPGSCATCHNGTRAIGKPASHAVYQSVPAIASAACDTCHKAGFAAWNPVKLHAGVTVTNQCATCHASARPADVIHAGQTTCEGCHKSTGAWAGAKVDHSVYNASSNCASCHNGTAATGKNATHIPFGSAGCGACHTSTSAWKPSPFKHTEVPVADCASCHSGAFPPADGKNATHVAYQNVSGLATAN
ncbi:MAG TPA: cytochrome c3 family protein, partial [Telluria sp.]|nr:cytochrome c3 family protein [Telluria sp.]